MEQDDSQPRTEKSAAGEAAAYPHAISPFLSALRPRRTGATIVVLNEQATIAAASRRISKILGTASSTVGLSELASIGLDESDMIVIEELNIAIVPTHPLSGAAAVSTLLDDQDVVEVRPEVYLFVQQEFRDTAELTWGIQAVAAHTSPFTGSGIKLAVLDTGIDLRHQDFEHRTIVSESFVPGENVTDLQGHGTHCAGTAVGKSTHPGVPRYGVAPDAELYVGKVLDNLGTGAERNILAGINWAIDRGCQVISMSLSGAVTEGGLPSRLYERVGSRALDNGCLILAASGNDSNRDFGVVSPVGSPANASSILAVGAVNPWFKPTSFSNGGINPGGGALDLVAPGLNIFSAAPMPRRYRSMSGTSMACPHAAGVAALWAQSDASLRGKALWDALKASARSLDHHPIDVGAGLVQAPQGGIA